MRHIVSMCVAFACTATVGYGASIVVPGTASPWLAGMPNGTGCCRGGSAPDNSPVLFSGLDLIAGNILMFSATGSTAHGPTPNYPADGAPGPGFTDKHDGPENGMSDIIQAPFSALMGVFLDDAVPSGFTPPEPLDYSQPGGLEFVTFSPLLRQVFFIGDGRKSSGAVQQFVVPAGATRLFLGILDSHEWQNNSGSLTVTSVQSPVPEPGTILVFIPLMALILVAPRIRHKPIAT